MVRIQKGSAFSVSAGFVAQLLERRRRNARNCNQKRNQSQDTSNDKSKDPLEGNELGEKLGKTNSENQSGRGETDSPVMVKNKEKARNQKEFPNKHIGNDSSKKAFAGVEGNGTIPKDGIHDPG